MPSETLFRKTRLFTSADDVVAVDADVQGEMVARSRRDADERQAVRLRNGCDDRERSVSARDAERIRAAGNLGRGERGPIVAASEDAHGDAALIRTLDEARAFRATAAGHGVDEQDRPLRRIDPAPGI